MLWSDLVASLFGKRDRFGVMFPKRLVVYETMATNAKAGTCQRDVAECEIMLMCSMLSRKQYIFHLMGRVSPKIALMNGQNNAEI